VPNLTKPPITLDGSLSDWLPSERIDYNDVPGFSLYSVEQGGTYYFALSGNVAIGDGTTFWLDTDLDTSTGFDLFGQPTGSDYNVMLGPGGTVGL